MKKKIFIITGAVVLLFSFYLLSCHKEWANPAYDKEGNPVGSNINIPGEVIWNTNSAFLPQVPSGTDLLYDAHVYYDTDTGTVSIVMEPYEQLHQLYIVVDYLGSYTTNTMVLDNNNNYVYQDGGFDYGDMIDFFFVAEKDNDLWCGDLPPAYPHSVVLGSSASSFSSSNFSSSFFTSSSGFSSSMPMVSSSSIFFSSSGSGTIVTNTLFWSNAVNDCFLDEGGGGAAADMPHNGTEMLLTCDQTSSDDSLRLCVLVDGFQGQLSNAYTIESAMLWLYCIGVSTDPPDSSETFEVYPLDMPWMEGEACWNKPDSSHSNWNGNTGGSWDSFPLLITNFYCDNSLVNNWVAFPIEPDLIMDIATNGRPNYGLIIMNSSETGEGANRYLKFATREEGHTEYLEIVYTEIM